MKRDCYFFIACFLRRALVVNGTMFPVATYLELKCFFDKALAADQEQLVLQNTHAAASGIYFPMLSPSQQD